MLLCEKNKALFYIFDFSYVNFHIVADLSQVNFYCIPVLNQVKKLHHTDQRHHTRTARHRSAPHGRAIVPSSPRF